MTRVVMPVDCCVVCCVCVKEERMANNKKRFKLRSEHELRIQVDSSSGVCVRLVDGSAEIFGTPLDPHRWIDLPRGHSFPVYTWNGAVIEMSGNAKNVHITNETPMRSYWDIHSLLESKRAQARDADASLDSTLEQSEVSAISMANSALQQSKGPRVILVGPTDSGKSSLARMLLGWATMQGWVPTCVDLDIGQGAITVPGTISAIPVHSPVDPVKGIPLRAPLVYFYGHTTPSVNAELYKVLVERLARALDTQVTGDLEACAAGLVINTMGWVEGLGYELLLHAIDSLRADMVLVLGQENLYYSLVDAFKGRDRMDILHLHQSSGVVTRNSKFRQWTRNSRIKEYFYGLSDPLCPHLASAYFNQLHIFRIVKRNQDSRTSVTDPICLQPVQIDCDLICSVLAVSFARAPEELILSNVAGFIYITEVDIQRRTLSYFAPCANPLPSNFLLAGSLKWLK